MSRDNCLKLKMLQKSGGCPMVLTKPGLREEPKTRGLKQAAKFSWDKTAEETMKVYEEVEQRLEKSILAYQSQALI